MNTRGLFRNLSLRARALGFKDYATQVFGEVAEGRLKLGPLPTDKMVAHYQRCRNATMAIRTGLTRLGLGFKEIYYEELYSGSEAGRL